MRLFLSIWFFCTFALLVNAQSTQLLKFETETTDIGFVKKGDLATGAFTFTNVSDEDVTIDLVSTCECTDAQWPSDPIGPGETGEISFTFDSNKKDEEESIDIDVILQNVNKEGIPYFYYLSYTYSYSAK